MSSSSQTPDRLRITLAGSLGSGKSTLGNVLTEELGIPLYSTGTMFRELAKSQNIDALQANLASEENFDFDHYVDNFIKSKDADEDSFIFDSRMAWHFVSDAYRLFLTCSLDVAATRISQQSGRIAEDQKSVPELIDEITQRRASEIKRYRTLYSVNIENLGNYDLVIATDFVSAEDIQREVLNRVRSGCAPARLIAKSQVVPHADVPHADAADPTVSPVLKGRFDGHLFHAAASGPELLAAFSTKGPFAEIATVDLPAPQTDRARLMNWQQQTRIDFLALQG